MQNLLSHFSYNLVYHNLDRKKRKDLIEAKSFHVQIIVFYIVFDVGELLKG